MTRTATRTKKQTPPVEAEQTPPVEAAPVEKKPKAPKWDALDAERAAWVANHARPAVSNCLCGCGGSTKGRFVPGHDATLKATLAVTAEHGEGTAKTDAEAALATFGW